MTHVFSLFADLLAQPWAIEPSALEALLAKLQAVADRQPQATSKFARSMRSAAMSVDANGVATIPVSGVLVQSVPAWAREWELEATGYDEILDDLKAAAADPKVRSVTLAIESPGGMVSGLADVVDAVHSLKALKPVKAETRSLMASAAYHLGSQASSIVAGPNAMVGSIGVYSAMWDTRKLAEDKGIKVHRIASGPHKGAGMFGTEVTADQIKAQQQLIDGLAANFKRDVARGRRASAEVVDGWATGEMWIGEDAAKRGLVDRVERNHNAFATSSGVPAAADLSTKGESMTDQEKAAAADKAKQEALAAERQRIADIKAAFPKHLDFALAQIEKGATLAEAKGAFAEVLAAENTRLAGENANLKKAGEEAAKGGTAVPHGGTGGSAPVQKDFMTLAREDRDAHRKACPNYGRGQRPESAIVDCCSLTSAMRRVRDEKPEAHHEFIKANAAKAPAVHERKQQLGMQN